MRTKNEKRDREKAIREAAHHRAVYWANPEVERKRKREYYHANREKVLARVHQYRAEIRRSGRDG